MLTTNLFEDYLKQERDETNALPVRMCRSSSLTIVACDSPADLAAATNSPRAVKDGAKKSKFRRPTPFNARA